MSDTPGYVYVLSNPAMPGIVKIGRSKHSGRIRAVEIYKQGGTGVPMPFKMEFEIWSKDCVEAELLIHEILDDKRINSNREFFSIDIEVAVKNVMDVVGAYEYHLVTGDASTTLIADGDLIWYAANAHELNEELFPGIAWQVVITKAIGEYLDNDSVFKAIRKYKEHTKIKEAIKNDHDVKKLSL